MYKWYNEPDYMKFSVPEIESEFCVFWRNVCIVEELCNTAATHWHAQPILATLLPLTLIIYTIWNWLLLMVIDDLQWNEIKLMTKTIGETLNNMKNNFKI